MPSSPFVWVLCFYFTMFLSILLIRMRFHIAFMEFYAALCYNLCVMKNVTIQKVEIWARHMFAASLAVVLLIVCAPVARADGGVPALGDCSDDIQRIETRLSDLGYLKSVVNGRWDQPDADAFSAFAAANGVSVNSATELLFSNSAIAATLNGGTVFASGPQGFLLTYGALVAWDEIQPKLVVGQSYDMTSCYSGISLHMKLVAIGNNAKMQPELDWDNATLRGFFSSASSSEKQPVVITLDGARIAASIQQAAPLNDPAALPVYSVYFHNSSTGINGIPDAEHEAIIQIAANQQP